MSELSFTVLGKPQPGGSKSARVIYKAGVPTGQVAVTDANPKAKSWQQEVRLVAIAATNGLPLLTDAVNVSFTFYRQRPKSHYGTGRNAHVLKGSAPPFPTQKPDALKYARSTEDALTGIVYRDDAQVVDLDVHKRYGVPERCEITVRFTPPATGASS
jgi:Holliday junction resolvase RusA-like endonuclease